jgi:hypothetical protein
MIPSRKSFRRTFIVRARRSRPKSRPPRPTSRRSSTKSGTSPRRCSTRSAKWPTLLPRKEKRPKAYVRCVHSTKCVLDSGSLLSRQATWWRACWSPPSIPQASSHQTCVMPILALRGSTLRNQHIAATIALASAPLGFRFLGMTPCPEGHYYAFKNV